MGVRGLMSYCKRIQKPVQIYEKPLSLGIDAFSLIFLFREERDKFTEFLKRLHANHNMTFVMDKRAQKEKKETVDERKDIRSAAKSQVTEVSSFTQSDTYQELDPQQKKILAQHLALKERDAWCMYPEYVKWVKGMVASLGIPIVMAEEEADTVLAKGFEVVITSDSDLLILGCTIWIPRMDSLTQVSQEDFLQLVGLEGEQLYELAFLCGCDVQPRKIVDIQTAVSLLRFYGSIEKIKSISPDDLSLYKKLRTSVW